MEDITVIILVAGYIVFSVFGYRIAAQQARVDAQAAAAARTGGPAKGQARGGKARS